ncbi:MAG: hypothetical protein JKX87_02205 [Cycloclasticus sp.]|nr:hypothetical protein [Cycloclasticus sp.]
MCKKITVLLMTLCLITFAAYADEEIDGLSPEIEEVSVQKFYDLELLTETLIADDEEVLVAVQEANQIAVEADQAAQKAQAAANEDPENAELAETASDLQALADQTNAVETDVLTAIEEEFKTEFNAIMDFVANLLDEQVFALNRALNNAVNSGLLVDIDSEDLALLEGANKLQINAFTQAFEQDARFQLKADMFAIKAEETGDDKFLEMSERMEAKGEDQKEKFLARMDYFSGSSSGIANGGAKDSAQAVAKPLLNRQQK